MHLCRKVVKIQMEVNVKNINNLVSKVYKGSIAEEIGIEVGDVLLSVNGERVEDIIQYKFLISDEYIELEIQKINGRVYLYEIEKDYDEELGIEFTNPIIDKAKSCRNKCVFCFIDQLPKGMRLYTLRMMTLDYHFYKGTL